MRINKKTRNFFNELIREGKNTGKQVGRFVSTYSPKVNRFSRRTSENVQNLFEIKPGRNAAEIDFSTRSICNHDRDIVAKNRRNKVDWNNLGMRY